MQTNGCVRIGVIGAGRMAGYTLLELMKDHPAAKAVAWYEIDCARPDTAGRIPLFRQRGVYQCGSLDELLRRDDLDIILNTTPHYAHAQTSIDALKAGHDVLCEKPPACSWDHCQAMIAASKNTGNRLLIHFQHILRPSARWLNRKLMAGEIGRVRRVRCMSLWWRDAEYYRRVPWAGRRMVDGLANLDGVMANQSAHYLNQMLNLAQRTAEADVAMPAEMHARMYRFHDHQDLEVEDTVVARGVLDNDDHTEFHFAATTCASVSASADRVSEYRGLPDQHRIVFEGEHGTACWDGTARIDRPGEAPQIFNEPEGHWPFYFHLQRVLRCEEPPVTPVDKASRTMRFIFAAYAACGDRIRQAPMTSAPQVAGILNQCEQALCLPHELPAPPAWA